VKRISFIICLMLASCLEKPTPVSDNPPSKAGPDRWEPSNNAVVAGDIKTVVVQAGVELIHVEGVQDRTDVFAVRLSVDNTSHSKRHQYRTWATNASLTDNFANPYKCLPRPHDMGVRDVPLNPTAPVNDVLIFEAPITTAGYVDLHLPGADAETSDINFRIQLHTSGARLDAVTKAAAAVEADAKAKSAAIASREAEAKRRAEAASQEAIRLEGERRVAEEAEKAKQQAIKLEAEKARLAAEAERRAAELAAEKLRLEDEQRKAKAALEAEILTLPGKLATAQTKLEDVQNMMKKIKAATSRYAWSGPKMPDDYFIKEKYIYYGLSQKIARTKQVQEDIEQLTGECATLEARIKAGK
jgi:hypothetical protein